jgi:RNA polymerase sigma factor (sigma-70 family)
MTTQELITENQNLVHYVCHKHFKNMLAKFEYEDIASVGMFGLVTAAKKFCPSRGIKFSTYAYHLIWGYIKRYIRDYNEKGIVIPRRQKLAGTKVSCVSFQDNVTDDGNITIESLLFSEQDFTAAEVQEFLDKLTSKEKGVCLLLMDGYSQAQAAKVLGISQPHVSRLLAKVKKKYRQHKGEESDKGKDRQA